MNGTGLVLCAVFGAAVRLDHVVGVAVVGGDQAGAAARAHGVADAAEAGVDRLDRRDGGRQHAGVADHVGVGEVDDHEVERRRFASRAPARR